MTRDTEQPAIKTQIETVHKDDTRLPATAICKPALPPEARGSGIPAAISAAGKSSPITKKPLLPPEARQRGGSGVRGTGGGGGDGGVGNGGGGGKGSNPMGRHGGAVKGGWCVSMKVTSLDKAARARAAALEREQQRVAMERARNMRADEPSVTKKLHVLKPGKRNEDRETCTLKFMHACTNANMHAHAHVRMSMQTTRQVHVQSHTPQHAFTCSPSLWNGKYMQL